MFMQLSKDMFRHIVFFPMERKLGKVAYNFFFRKQHLILSLELADKKKYINIYIYVH